MRHGKPVSERWYQSPSFLFMSPHNFVGAHDPVAIPPGCELMDLELEVAVVIGRDGRNLTRTASARARRRGHDHGRGDRDDPQPRRRRVDPRSGAARSPTGVPPSARRATRRGELTGRGGRRSLW